MTLDIWYTSVWDKLEEIVKTVIPNTVQGSRDLITSFPGCAIIPGAIEPIATTPERSNYLTTFEVVVGVEGTTPTDSLKQALGYANKILEKIANNRDLSHIVDNTEVTRLTPEFERLPQYLRCWTHIIIQCRTVRR